MLISISTPSNENHKRSEIVIDGDTLLRLIFSKAQEVILKGIDEESKEES